MADKWFDRNGRLLRKITLEQARMCAEGQSPDRMIALVEELGFSCPREMAVDYIARQSSWIDCGDWDDEMLSRYVLRWVCAKILRIYAQSRDENVWKRINLQKNA